jgi:hypothetical protein
MSGHSEIWTLLANAYDSGADDRITQQGVGVLSSPDPGCYIDDAYGG